MKCDPQRRGRGRSSSISRERRFRISPARRSSSALTARSAGGRTRSPQPPKSRRVKIASSSSSASTPTEIRARDLRLEPGTLVDVDGPLGRFTFPAHPSERRFLFIAGGTGISPLRAMLHHALNVPHDEIGLLFSARTPAEFAYEQEFRALAEAHRIELELRVTREVGDDWDGVRGRLGRERFSAARPRSRDALLCVRTAGARAGNPSDACRFGSAARADQDRGVAATIVVRTFEFRRRLAGLKACTTSML